MSDIKRDSSRSPENGYLDDLIADTSSLIASVYEILETPRRPTAVTATPLLGRRSHNNSDSSGQLGGSNSSSNSPKSPKTPRLCPLNRVPLSTPSTREIDREINRIDRFCEMLEHNLRSVAQQPEQLIEGRLDSTSPNSPARGAVNRSPGNTSQRVSEQILNQNSSPTPDVVLVDLSDSMNMPAPIRPPNQLNMSDDVIIVTPSEDEIVDLCTPTIVRKIFHCRTNFNDRMFPNSDVNVIGTINGGGTAEIPIAQPTNDDRPSWRRSLSSYMSRERPNVASSSRNSVSTATSRASIGNVKNRSNNQNKNRANRAPGAPSNVSVATVTTNNSTSSNNNNNNNNSGRAPLMCAVCMESSINNQPTSTKCGHVFCANCIRQALRLTRKCPMCNTKLTPSMLFRIYV
ncbi:hybrid signal transduction histidine kinase A-like isoform X1 [Rhagoletis pomonella]|uniref:hybrid signal transduction histidine kinase A-like isoform X1 n=1 Tax=Rhagoletis pomonella TaxID=28610 RepID=UPI00177FBBD0|nr:hybrid signal transduction histidine kinase A-like isoform X1 [Rhagoletis pomonella]